MNTFKRFASDVDIDFGDRTQALTLQKAGL